MIVRVIANDRAPLLELDGSWEFATGWLGELLQILHTDEYTGELA